MKRIIKHKHGMTLIPRYGTDAKTFWATISLNRACNYHCSYCCQNPKANKETSKDRSRTPLLPADAWIRFIDALSALLRKRGRRLHLEFMDGEVTLRKDLLLSGIRRFSNAIRHTLENRMRELGFLRLISRGRFKLKDELLLFEASSIGRVVTPSDLHPLEDRFKNCSCAAGIDGIAVESNGDILRAQGSKCMIKIGNILSDRLEIPVAPIICPGGYCGCERDVSAAKFL